jgi:uncharacterized protein YpuA (DUF1002 family)
MNLLKTPHQLLLEEAGATPASPGLLHTPKQMLMQEAGVTPKFAAGGQVSVNDMLAQIIAANQTPQKFAVGSSVKNIASQSALEIPFIPEEAKQIAGNIKAQKYPEAAAQTAGVGYSAFAPINPLTALISGLTYSPELGDSTIEGFKKQEQERQLMQQYQAKLKADEAQKKANLLQKIKETRFYKQ